MKKKKTEIWPVIGLSCSGAGLAASILLVVLNQGKNQPAGTAWVLLGCCVACLIVNLISFLQAKKKK